MEKIELQKIIASDYQHLLREGKGGAAWLRYQCLRLKCWFAVKTKGKGAS